ncbi:Leucine-rich repeat-containing protein [Artemisia annua]|uniref:Leucine-rich repeat-containing protein n=1 Tax=Artemisia annua TaxID=35608 RepID=A0A2U1PM86_ARTAN|nr:Leucine-rich repeat-containing protein [Artemisia annua]
MPSCVQEATGLSGNIPNSVGHLKSLNYLDLSWTDLAGEIPDSIGNLILLENLDLSATRLSGEIPYSIDNMRLLNTVDLSMCNFTGSLPKYLGNLTHLTTLYLSKNYLSGSLPSSLFTLPSLETIYIDNNIFTGSLPPELFTLQPLKQLSVANNQLVGLIDVLDPDPALRSFRQLKKLTYIDLSYNNFNGTWELDTLFSSLRNLDTLILSYSGLLVVSNSVSGYVNPYFRVVSLASCKLSTFPNSLRAMKKLSFVDLSHNQIYGSLPNWVGEMGENDLIVFNISHNFVTSLPPFEWDMLQYLSLASNSIQGPFPLSICNMNNLYILDMSNNLFNGVIPRCFGYFSSHLKMVDLGNNSFHGTIPNTYEDCEELGGIILNGNQLEGEIPSSFSKCQSLNILDLGNNNLNGTFPPWLANLPELQVLILKSNRFQGLIESPFVVKLPFPSLVVLDLSQNSFMGNLPIKYFGNFKAMQKVVENGELEYMHIDSKYYSITIAVKGVMLPFSKVLVTYMFVDLSSNMFGSEIPDIIGDIAYLRVLNLSRNNLIGGIPSTIGNLLHIESLDLSWNQLTGQIPQSLTGIKGLGVLNLSQNRLVGRIPEGRQFNTFDESSFAGNLGLCGFPMPEKCNEQTRKPQLEAHENHEEKSGFTRKSVTLGYGCGTLLGLVMGYLMLSTRRVKWFNAIADAGEHIILMRNKRRYVGTLCVELEVPNDAICCFRNSRLFKGEKKDSKIVLNTIKETVGMKLLSLTVKDSRSVKDVEAKWNLKLQRTSDHKHC